MNTRNSVRMALAAVSIASLGLAGSAGAGTVTGSLTVTANVTDNCAISTTTQLAFGSYDIITNPTGTPLTSATPGLLSVTCTTGDAITIYMDQGLNPTGASSAAAPARQMINGSNLLAYGLYQDAGFTTVWGATNGTAVGFTGTGTANNYSVYGSVPGGQNVPAALYSDTVVITVNF